MITRLNQYIIALQKQVCWVEAMLCVSIPLNRGPHGTAWKHFVLQGLTMPNQNIMLQLHLKTVTPPPLAYMGALEVGPYRQAYEQ